MLVEVKMPVLAPAHGKATIVRWLIKVGGSVKIGQPLLEIETDKATMEVESVAGGILKEIRAQAGARVFAGSVIAIIDGNAAGTAIPRLAEPSIVIRPAKSDTPPRPIEHIDPD